MRYKIELSDGLDKTLCIFPKKDRERILNKIYLLSENPRPIGYKKMIGTKNPCHYRIKCGKYRIVYSIQDDVLLIVVIDVDHRKDIYKK